MVTTANPTPEPLTSLVTGPNANPLADLVTSPEQPLNLFQDGILIDVKCSYWRGKAALSPEDLGLEEKDVPEIFNLGRKSIVPRVAMRKFERIDQRARFLTDRFTFPFPTGRSRFIPYAVLNTVLDELKTLQVSFDEAISSFMLNLDEYRKEMVSLYPEHKAAIERGYMSEQDLRRRYHFNWLLYEVQLPTDLKVKAIDERDAVLESNARENALAQATEEYRSQFAQQMDEFLNSAVGSLRESVSEQVIKLSTKLSSGEKIGMQSIKALTAMIDQFKSLNFVGDTEVSTKLEELEALIPESAAKFNEAEFAQAFKTALDGVSGVVVESDISNITGEYKRKIRKA